MEPKIRVLISIGVGGLVSYSLYKAVSNAIKKGSLADLIALDVGIIVGIKAMDAVNTALANATS